MNNSVHTVITKDYPENLVGGIMICGINFGYSKEDEKQEQEQAKKEINVEQDPLSFFSDKAVNDTRFRNRVLTWLSSWGFELATQKGEEGAFERSFFQTNWLDTQTRSTTSNDAITCDTLVEQSDSFLRLLETRKPSVIIFFGDVVIEALSDIGIRDRVVSILGERSGNAENHRADLPGYTGTRFMVRTQTFGETQIIRLPHPTGTIGISDEYVAALKPPLHVIRQIIDKSKNK